MPWSNQSGGGGSGGGGGPWGSGGGGGGGKKDGGGPWGQGPNNGGSGGNQAPDLEDLLKRSQEKLRRVMPGGSGGGGGQGGLPGSVIFLGGMVLAVLFGIWAFTFRVNPDQVGIVMQFGKYVRRADPGWHLKLPPPIEEVMYPTVTRQNVLEIGRLSSNRGTTFTTSPRNVPEESLMLTGDENIVDVDFVVRWSIKPDKVQDFLFNIEIVRKY